MNPEHITDKELKDVYVRRLEEKRLPRQNSEKNYNSGEKCRKTFRKVKRSSSAVETNRHRERPKIRRSISEIGPNGNLLNIPPRRTRHSTRRSRGRPTSEISADSESSSRTVSSQPASIAELVAQELGLKEVPGKGAKEATRRRAIWAITLTSLALLIASVLLVAVTLLLSPAVDAILRKENEEIFRGLSPTGTSTLPPEPDNRTVLPVSTTGQSS